ncbi:MAG: L,D-transpeptidase, partial [Bacteroidales bacterium]|nr:L,D-transpeptidase [Bacteroidales bacterium]
MMNVSTYRVILLCFGLLCLTQPLSASFEDNPFIKNDTQQTQKGEKAFIFMINDEHSIAMEKTKVKEVENTRLKKIAKAKMLQAKVERLLKLETLQKEEAKTVQAKVVPLPKIEILQKEEVDLPIEPKKIELENKNIFTTIDILNQNMKVFKGKELLYTWKVSTGKNGHRTPRGNYKPIHTTKMHYSSKYNNAPMPYSVFFHKGYAIHGTNSVSKLGKKAS